jgi:glycosyltransferase involved in cell wall biosynthesis
MKTEGWLINDCLTCIPNTKTLWHFLLEIFPNLIDKTNGHTPFHQLNFKIENEIIKTTKPDFIIRNASYFPKLNTSVKTISILQDIRLNDEMQIEVCNNSDIVVCVSNYVKNKYKDKIKSKIEVIPVGTDFNLFNSIVDKELIQKELDILPNSILFIGASTIYPKGFDLLMKLVYNTNYNFCFVMKDDWCEKHPRIKIFNKIDHSKLRKIINACDLLVCTSQEETLHLAGVEAAACNIPLICSNVGIYHEMPNGKWGRLIKEYKESRFIEEINHVFKNKDYFEPRKDFLEKGLDIDSFKQKWIKIVDNL